MPMDVSGLSAYPDFLAFGITLLLTSSSLSLWFPILIELLCAVMLAVGVKESTRFNSVFTGLNLLVVCFVVIAGSFKADLDNWRIDENDIPKGLVASVTRRDLTWDSAIDMVRAVSSLSASPEWWPVRPLASMVIRLDNFGRFYANL